MLETLLYLVANYWIALGLALVIGIAAGWVSYPSDEPGGEH